MFVPPGLKGSAKWGEVWLVRKNENLDDDLRTRERLVMLALLGKDAEFLRNQRPALLELGVIREKLRILARGEIPTASTLPPERTIGAATPFDSIITGIRVESRPATAPELAAGLSKTRTALKDSVKTIKRRLQTRMDRLRAERSDQKQIMFGGARGSATPYKVMASPVLMDGSFIFESVRPGDYLLYAQYSLQEWFVTVPITVSGGTTQKDIPRLPGVLLDSKAIISSEALCNQILAM
jgi:hypothetical protein